MGLERRVRNLEDASRPGPKYEGEREKQRREIREQAEHANYCRWGEEFGRWPLFEIDEDGDALCTHDGLPVMDLRQILAELFYWMEVEWGGPGLRYDEEAEAFYTPGGELVLSRYVANLQHLLKR